MRKTLYFAALAVIMAAASSCDKEVETVAPAVPGASDEITFVTRSADFVETRGTGVTEVTTASLTTFNVIATTGSGSETSAWSAAFSLDGTSYKGGQYWPDTNPGYHFYASNAAMTFAASGTTIAVADSDTDVVAAYLASPTYKSSNLLTFGHILCQVGTATVKAPAGYTVTGFRLAVSPVYSGTYSMQGATWTPGSPSSAVYLIGTAAAGVDIEGAGGSYTSADNDLWLVPGTYVLTATYTISKGNFSKEYTKTASVALVMGKNNNLVLPGANHDEPNIPDPGDDISDIVFTVEVTPWSNNDIPVTF